MDDRSELHEDASSISKDAGLQRDALPLQDGALIRVSRFPWYLGGGLIWAFSDNSFLHPTDFHPQGESIYVAQVRLRRNDADPRLNDASLGTDALVGDSEIILRGSGMPKEFMMTGIPGTADALVSLRENNDGRLGSIIVTVNAMRTIDVYRLTQTVFNKVSMAVAVQFGIPIRHSGMQINRVNEAGTDEWARVIPIGYTDAHAPLGLGFSKVVAHFYASYAEGIRANSPFYALLCFFTLVEFITTTLQGNFRRYNRERRITYVDLKGSLSAQDVRFIGHFLAGTTYDEVLRQTRETRNAIAHFITNAEKVMPRPFNVESEDQVSFYRDALKVAGRDLLGKVEQNLIAFTAAGATEDEMRRVIEGTYWDQ